MNPFLARWGIDLVKWCIEAWAKRYALEDPFWTNHVTRLTSLAFERG